MCGQATLLTHKGLVGKAPAPPTRQARDAVRPHLPRGSPTGNLKRERIQPNARGETRREERKGGSCRNQQPLILTVQASAPKRLGTLVEGEEVGRGWRGVRGSIAGRGSIGGSCTNQ